MLPVCPNVFGCNSDQLLTFSGGDRKGYTKVFTISESHKNKLPAWKPGQGNPPIDFIDAFELASKQLTSTDSVSPPSWELFEINAMAADKGSVWFYQVGFAKLPIREILGRRSGEIYETARYIVVLMDGTVLMGNDVKEKQFWGLVRKNDCK